jgi:ankyrin repeat protein
VTKKVFVCFSVALESSSRKILSLRKFVQHLVSDISPTEIDMNPLKASTEWITNRLLSYRSFDDDAFAEGTIVFADVKQGGSTARRTAIRPIHDVDLVAFMKNTKDGLTTTFEHVMGAMVSGSESVVRSADDSAIVYNVVLADRYHPEEFRKFVIRWQRHSFGICFGEKWDNTKTTFDIVPVQMITDRLHLTSRFSHHQEANPESISSLKSEVVDGEALQEAIRLFKSWNKQNKIEDVAPFASFELEAALSMFWTLPDIVGTTCVAERIVLLFKHLYCSLGAQFRIPGLSDERGAYQLLGRGNSFWSSLQVKELVRMSMSLLGSTYYNTYDDDPQFAVAVWDDVFQGRPLNSVSFELHVEEDVVDDEMIESAGYTRLHCALLNDEPADAIEKLVNSTDSIDDVDNNGRTALYFAAGRGRSDIVEMLLLKGADPLKVDGSGCYYDSLHRSVFSRSYSCVELLLNHEESMSSLTVEDKSNRLGLAMRIAAHFPDENIIILLLSKGADINYVPYSREESPWQILLTATGSISVDLLKILLSHQPSLNFETFGLLTMRGDQILVAELFRFAFENSAMDFRCFQESVRIAVQLGYHDILEWILENSTVLTSDTTKEVDFAQLMLSLVMSACSLGFNEVISVILKSSPYYEATVLQYCTLEGHYGALKAICSKGVPFAFPNVSDCLRTHSRTVLRGHKAAAEYFAAFIVRCINMQELADYLYTCRGENVVCVEIPAGRLPLFLCPLLFDENMTPVADEFLVAADRKRMHLFAYGCGHPLSPRVRVCAECDALHFSCFFCEISTESNQHCWEITEYPSNAPMIDLVLGKSNEVEVLVRLGLVVSVGRWLEAKYDIKDDCSTVVKAQIEMLQVIKSGDPLPLLPSYILQELVDPRVLKAADEKMCSRKISGLSSPYLAQFYYECYTCGLIRTKGCCEFCFRTCHYEHDAIPVPRFSEQFECDCVCSKEN